MEDSKRNLVLGDDVPKPSDSKPPAPEPKPSSGFPGPDPSVVVSKGLFEGQKPLPSVEKRGPSAPPAHKK
jgi:hypothetical protein